MDEKEVFSIGKTSIALRGIATMEKFARFHAQKPNIFLDGIELDEDLKNEADTIFYTKGTKITHDRMKRLVRMSENNPNMKFVFNIKRSPELIQSFRAELKAKMSKLLRDRLSNRIFKHFFEPVQHAAAKYLDEILANEDVAIAIYKMRFVCKLSPSKFAPPFFEHSLLVGLFSLGIASTEQYAPAVAGDTAKLAEIMKAGIIHNSEALSNIDAILQLPEIKRSDTYWESIRNGYFVLGTLKLGYDTMDAIRILCEYFLGRKDFIGHDDIMNKSEWPSIMANIILVADAYLQKEKGLFGIPQSPRQAIDALNVSTVEKNYNKIAIAALTIGLKFEDIFDFYREMDKLIKECPSNAAWPYPLTGFKSPTIFVCKGNCVECNYYEKMMQAVTLLKPLGDLPEGNYSRCLLLTPKLISFYKSHYDEIKEETAEKAKAPKKE